MSEVKWRRKWKPDLHSCSWQPLKNLVKDGIFLVKAKFSDSSYEFLATDLVEFWYEKLDLESLKKRSAKLNPNIEAPLTKIVDQIKASLWKEGSGTDLSLSRKNDMIVLTVTSQLAGLPFTWTFRAESTAYDMARDHLSLPLMAMVGELSRQKQELFKLLAAKDKQIDDYKAQGAKVSRKHFETIPFDEVAFNSSMVTSKGFEDGVKAFEDQIFNRSSQDLYRNICTKQAWLRHGVEDLNNLDSDDDMESGDSRLPSAATAGAPSVESWANRIPESFANRNNAHNAAATASPSKSVSPVKASPNASPSKTATAMSSPSKSSSNESTPVKDTELLRRQALERKLEQEETKKMEKAKKKKKLKL